MKRDNSLDVGALIDEKPMGMYQKIVVFLGFLIIAIDGFDVSIVSFIAPQLRTTWGISAQMLGPVISAALIGLAVGAVVAGPMADRFGRRGVLLCSIAFVGVWTIATAFSTSVTEMVIFRFFAGVGLGAAMPNAGTLVAEFAPKRRRALVVTLAFTGFSFGAAGGGLLAAWMIPAFGWHSVVLVGGILPLLLLPVLWMWMPESVGHMILKGAPQARILRVVNRIAPGIATASTRFVWGHSKEESAHKGNPIALIFSSRYRFGTLMLWVVYFVGLFLVYLLGNWLPTLVKDIGYSVSEAAQITSLYQIGGTTGALTIGYLLDRVNGHRAMAAIYVLGAGVVYMLGQSSHQFSMLAVFAFLAGVCITGTSVGASALAAQYYPLQSRATGLSWMHGMGRWGGILSAFAGAQMISWGWNFEHVFNFLVIPSLIVAVALVAKDLNDRKDQPAEQDALPLVPKTSP